MIDKSGDGVSSGYVNILSDNVTWEPEGPCNFQLQIKYLATNTEEKVLDRQRKIMLY